MDIYYGNGKSEFGPGVQIDLSGEEVARAISAYLLANGVYVNGPRSIRVNGEFTESGSIYVDPSGWVERGNKHWAGRGKNSRANVQTMATPPAGAAVDRGVEVELRGVIENKRAGGGCHPWLVRLKASWEE